MHGDLVLVDISNVRPDGRAEGRIVRPVMRANPSVVGTFHYGGRGNYVKAFDSKITQEILIPPGMEYPDASEVSDLQEVEPQKAARPQKKKNFRRSRAGRRGGAHCGVGRSGRRCRRRGGY